MTRGAAVSAVALSIACYSPPPGRDGVPPDNPSRTMTDVLDVMTNEGKPIRFEHVRSGSYGPKAINVIVGDADGLEPRVASCTSVGPANFHRDAPLGHHFQPELIDLKEAISRSKEIVEEVSYWPMCPMTWDVQDRRGVNYRYCARRKGETAEPPRPAPCQR